MEETNEKQLRCTNNFEDDLTELWGQSQMKHVSCDSYAFFVISNLPR